MNRIIKFATATRLATITIGIGSQWWTGSYDSSAEILLASTSSWTQSILVSLLRWDALYFLDIAQHGYRYEQQHAFLAMMPLMAQAMANTVLYPLQYVTDRQTVMLLSGVLVSNVAFVLAAIVLYKLTRNMFPKEPHLALISAMAFCLSPPALFMSSFYTESLFALQSFTGMYLVSREHYALASCVWAMASATRSNGMVYAGFFIYDLILRRIAQRRSLQSVMAGALSAAIYSSVTLLGFIATQWYGYHLYCEHPTRAPRPWCHDRLPSLYGFVQREYWNNGMFTYYTLQQLPNFLLAAPFIILSVCALWMYARQDWKRVLTGGMVTRIHRQDDRQLPYMVLWAFLLLYCVVCMHIQVILRFFSSLPPLYWYVAQVWHAGFRGTGRSRTMANVLLGYFVLYGLVGIVLFAAFLPPA